MAPFGLKLWENAFRMIPRHSFFDVKIIFLANIFDISFCRKIGNLPVLRRDAFFGVICRCASENDPRSFDFQLSTTFGRGVKEMVSFGSHDFGPKMNFAKVIYEITKL